ncbi:MAG: hypothetical protein QOE26_1627 [Verrucomicrobiota bacterium]
MSLKGFHIVFITVSTLLALGGGAWCLWIDSIHGSPAFRVGAICSFLAGLALIGYGICFYLKMKRLRIIT